MPGLDALPADQRAVLQLVLRGRSYDAIAQSLRLEPDAVRRRAHAAVSSLDAGDGVADDDRGAIADWLLGQRPDAPRVLLRDEAARGWATRVRADLEGAGAQDVPRLPPRGDDAPAVTDDAAAVAAAHPSGTPPGRPRPRRSSRRGGAILLAALALAAVIVAVTLVTRGGGDPATTTSDTTAGATSTADNSAPGTRVVAQVNLRAPSGAPRPKAIGVVQIVTVQGKQAIVAIVQGLPKPSNKVGFGVWLLSRPGGKRQWLGYFNQADAQGRLTAQGALAPGVDVTKFSSMAVTQETKARPQSPGTTYLTGTVATPQTQGAATGTTP